MRKSIVAAVAVVIIAGVAIWGTSPSSVHHEAASSSIDVMQMMRQAKDLPEQSFEAN